MARHGILLMRHVLPPLTRGVPALFWLYMATLVWLPPSTARAGSFSANFSSIPAGATLFGDARVTSSKLILTNEQFFEAGWLVVNDLDGGSAVQSFSASFRLAIGGGSPTGADGFSFSFGNLPDLPNDDPKGFSEEGVGAGLIIRFDTIQNDEIPNDSPNRIQAVYNNNQVDVSAPRTLRFVTPKAIPEALVSISVSSAGLLTLTHDNGVDPTAVFTNVPIPGWSPRAGWRFGVGARTGGSFDIHQIDDLVINTTLPPTPTSTPPSTATPTATPTPRSPRNFAYVTTSGNPDSISVINTSTNTLTDLLIPVQLGADFVAITPVGRLAYVSGPDGLTVIDTAELSVIKQLSVSVPTSGIARPVGRVAFNRDGSRAYVVNGNPAELSEIDTFDNEVIDAIPLGEAIGSGPPGGIGVTGDGIAYVTPYLFDAQSSIVAVDLTARSIAGTIESPCEVAISQDLAVALDDRRVYVPLFDCDPRPGAGSGTGVNEDCTGDCNSDDTVSLEELITGVNIALGQANDGACPNFAANPTSIIDDLVSAVESAIRGCFPPQSFEGNGLAVIGTRSNSILRVIPFGSLSPGDANAGLQPRGATDPNGTGIDITPDGRSLYVAGCNISNLVCVIDTSTDTLSARIPVFDAGQLAFDVAVTPDGRFAYVSSDSSRVRVIDIQTNTPVERFFIPENRGIAAGARQ